MSEQVTIYELKKRVASLALYPRGTKTYSRYLLDQAIDELADLRMALAERIDYIRGFENEAALELAVARERIRVLTEALRELATATNMERLRMNIHLESRHLRDDRVDAALVKAALALAGEALADTVQEGKP